MKIKSILFTLAVVIPTAFSFAQGPGGRRPPGPPPGGGNGQPPEQGAPGQMPPPPHFPPLIMLALDADGDGIISAAELANATESLKKLDTNGDGQLTPDEYLGALYPGPRKGDHKHHGNPGTSGTAETSASPAPNEASGMGHTMDPAAPKHAGRGPHGPPPWQIIEALDANGDGIISADEIANASAALKTLDKNGDGQLGPAEYGPKPPRLPKELEAYDKNGDGKLDLEETQAVIADIKSGKLKLPPPPRPQQQQSKQQGQPQQPPPDDSGAGPE